MEKKYKLISKPYVARHLLRLGNPIVDIKIDKYRENGTIFVFEITNKFLESLAVIEK